MEVDFSPLKGMKFNCLEGCGLCCTFQPELLKNEFKFYQQNKKTKNGVIAGSIDDPETKERCSFSLQNKAGGCVFLEKKKCIIYDIRPDIFFGWRIQLNVNMACRGVWDANQGMDLYSLGENLFANLPINLKRELSYKSKNFYESLSNNLKNYYVTPYRLREKALEYIESINLESGENYEYAKNLFKMQLNKEKLVELQTYATKDLRWEAFKLKDGSIIKIQLEENGNFKTVDSIDF